MHGTNVPILISMQWEVSRYWAQIYLGKVFWEVLPSGWLKQCGRSVPAAHSWDRKARAVLRHFICFSQFTLGGAACRGWLPFLSCSCPDSQSCWTPIPEAESQRGAKDLGLALYPPGLTGQQRSILGGPGLNTVLTNLELKHSWFLHI